MCLRGITVPEVAPLVRKIYDRHPCGCCLHIVLDDGNVKDEHVEFCLRFARQNNCNECEYVAKCLRLMSKTQRIKLGKCWGRYK